MQEDTVNDLKMIQEWFETNRVREAEIIENVKISQLHLSETR